MFWISLNICSNEKIGLQSEFYFYIIGSHDVLKNTIQIILLIINYLFKTKTYKLVWNDCTDITTINQLIFNVKKYINSCFFLYVIEPYVSEISWPCSKNNH